MGSLFAQALVLQTVQIPSLQLGLCFVSVLNKSVHGNLASRFEGLAIGKRFLLSVLNSNHLEPRGKFLILTMGRGTGEISLLVRPALDGVGLFGG